MYFDYLIDYLNKHFTLNETAWGSPVCWQPLSAIALTLKINPSHYLEVHKNGNRNKIYLIYS